MSIVVFFIIGAVILILLTALKSIKNSCCGADTGNLTQSNASNQTPPIERRDGFIVLKPRAPSNNNSITNNNNYNNNHNRNTPNPFIVTDNFRNAPKPVTVPKPIERINGAIVIKPRAPEPVSSTKPAATNAYKPPAVPSVWGSAPRTNPPRAQQQLPIISPSPVALPPTEYTNSLGIRLQVAPSASSSSTPTAAPTTSATSLDSPASPPPVYARSPQEIGEAHIAIAIDDQTPAPTPAQPRHPQQPYALEDIQFSSHPRPNVAIVIQADEDTTTSESTTI